MFLLTSDLHFTDKVADRYRFGVLNWLARQVRSNTKIKGVLLLGDLTDEKDNHSSELVNKIVKGLTEISEISPVYILKGNHDYIDETNPFFGFLSNLDNIHFITDPKKIKIDGERLTFLPHTRNPYKDWNELDDAYFNDADYIFLHQTLQGSLSSNGTEMEGMEKSYFEDLDALIISGDIHVPQKLGNIEYVGTPYRVRFGDNFEPRVMLVESPDKVSNLKYPCLKKHTVVIKEAGELYKSNIDEGDQVKVRLSLSKADVVDWKKYKQEVINACDDLGFQLHGVELVVKKRKELKSSEDTPKVTINKAPLEIFRDFCEVNKIDSNMAAYGRKLI